MGSPQQLPRTPTLAAPAAITLSLAAAALALLATLAGSAHAAHLDLSHHTLLAIMLVTTVSAELAAVRVRQLPGRGVAEELSLFEAAVVANALLLPPVDAVLVPALALLLASLALRRQPGRIAVSIGISTTSCVALVACVAGIGRANEGFHGGSVVLGLLIGTAAFVVANLVGTASVRARLTGVPATATLQQGWRLAVVMAIGTLALGASSVAVAQTAPLLLPFSLMPAAALTYAYAAVAEEGDERLRSQQLLALSHLMAGALDVEDLVTSFLALVREAFHASSALVVLESAGREETVVIADAEGVSIRFAQPGERALLATAGVGTELLPVAPTAAGPARVLMAPLDAEGRRLGIVALTEAVTAKRRFSLAAMTRTTERSCRLGPAEATVVGPLASALAVALRGAEHLARLTEETDKLQQVVDGSSDGIVVLDDAGVVVVWSPAMANLSGISELIAVGRPLASVVAAQTEGGEPVNILRAGWDLLTPEAPRATVELTLARPDGELRAVRCAHAAVFDVDDSGHRLLRDVVLIHDVTRDRQVERLKTDFIATVSHELRSPMTPIKGYVELLRRKGEDFTPAKRAEILELVSDRVSHLTRLVEDVLLASKVTTPASSVVMGAGDLAVLTRRTLGDFAVEAQRVSSEIAESLPVLCDPARVIQVASNLVSNALKYSPADSPVTVRAWEQDGKAWLSVRDVGRGIPADQLESVFEKFHRVEDPMKMTTGGTGLGLYIARQLAEAMGGSLNLVSSYGVGSTFTFTLPLATEADLAALPARPTGPRLPGLAPPQRLAGWPPFPNVPARA